MSAWPSVAATGPPTAVAVSVRLSPVRVIRSRMGGKSPSSFCFSQITSSQSPSRFTRITDEAAPSNAEAPRMFPPWRPVWWTITTHAPEASRISSAAATTRPISALLFSSAPTVTRACVSMTTRAGCSSPTRATRAARSVPWSSWTAMGRNRTPVMGWPVICSHARTRLRMPRDPSATRYSTGPRLTSRRFQGSPPATHPAQSRARNDFPPPGLPYSHARESRYSTPSTRGSGSGMDSRSAVASRAARICSSRTCVGLAGPSAQGSAVSGGTSRTITSPPPR
ncbi:hypothetical protein SUDANB132_06374 (plasmid) [Streptomyces sp. enrichment culture]